MAARPKTLPAGAMPVIMGAALAWRDGVFHAPAFLCALAGALLIQIATNYANDYFDFVKGADDAERVGPARATAAGLVTPGQMRVAAAIVLLLALVPGAWLIHRGGWPILAIGVFSLAFAVLYTGGPYPLAYLGLGDLFVLIFFGPVAVAGTYYVQALEVTPTALAAGLAPGLLSTAILTVNNLRDIDGDRRAGKRTLAVRFGTGFARWEYAVCVAGAILGVPPLLAFMAGGHWTALIACVAIAPGVFAIRAVWTRAGAALNPMLAGTGKLLVIFTLLFAIAWNL